MFPKYLFLSVFVFSLLLNDSYAQSWQWGKSGGSFGLLQNNEKVESMVTDSDGNLYVLCVVGEANLTLDGMPQPSYGGKDYMVASFSCSGEFRWSHVIGSGGYDNMSRIQIDAMNNIYIAGSIRRTTEGHIGVETTLPYSTQNNEHKENLYIIKYNSEGELQWYDTPHASDITVYEGSAGSRSLDIQTDPEGNSYWFCLVSAGVFGDGVLENTNEGDSYYIFKYNTEGVFVDAVEIEMEAGIGNEPFMVRNHDLEITYIGGFLHYEADPLTIAGMVVEDGMYLTAFDKDGSALWGIENTLPSAYGTIRDFCIGENGNLYLTGGSANGDTFADYPIVSSGVGVVPFVLKLDKDGNLIWGTNGQTGTTGTPSNAIAVNSNEVAITFGGGVLDWDDVSIPYIANTGFDVRLALFDVEDGTLTGLDSLVSNWGKPDYSSAICADNLGNFYAGGWFKNILYVANDTLVNGAGGWDFFMAKYGHDNCDCELPQPTFDAVTSTDSGTVFDFIYNSNIPYNTIVWDFGDGTTSTLENPTHTYTQNGEYNVCVTVTNECGTEETCNLVSAMLVGANSVDFEHVQVYPNPITDVLNINTDRSLSYTLYSILGSEVIKGNVLAGQTTVATEHLNVGTYFLVLKNEKGQEQSVQLIKE